jgi:hypothetical protein
LSVNPTVWPMKNPSGRGDGASSCIGVADASRRIAAYKTARGREVTLSRIALARAPRDRSHGSSAHHVVVHRITPITSIAKPSHRVRGHS